MNERSMRDLNLAFRFVLELIALLALFIWGFSMSDNLIIGLALGLGAPALVMAIWGTFVSPKAPRRLEDPARLVLEVVIFGAAVLGFVVAGLLIAGVLLGIAAAISLGLMVLWDQRGY
jgi:hypothetical protein